MNNTENPHKKKKKYKDQTKIDENIETNNFKETNTEPFS